MPYIFKFYMPYIFKFLKITQYVVMLLHTDFIQTAILEVLDHLSKYVFAMITLP